MLELDQILRANEINFAILAALPAFFLSLLLAMLVRAWFQKVSSLSPTMLYKYGVERLHIKKNSLINDIVSRARQEVKFQYYYIMFDAECQS